MFAIETTNLSKFYGKHRGIEDLSLTVREGDFFGFLGSNGAGKSTTIRTLLGLIAPTGGSAAVFGRDVVKDKLDILADVGYLPSEAIFYNRMRVRELLAFSARLRKKDCRQEAQALCERLSLDPDRRVGELSLGNRKKVGIVLALQHKPRLYILDEPTGGLDPLMQQAFFDILQERHREGATVFLSSHNLPEVSRHCSHAAVIRDGRLIVSDSIENLGHTGVKRVTLHGVAAMPDLPHVSNAQFGNGCARFLYDGDQNALIQALSSVRFTDITIADPDFEEVLLHYYTEEGEQ